MKSTPAEVSIHDVACKHSAWRSSQSVARWRDGLLYLTGCSPREAAERIDMLIKFCAEREVSPDQLIDQCRRHPDRAARRDFYLRIARGTPANPVVQSFMVHNGINVFGDLVCLPNTPESLKREQGNQWVSRKIERSRGSR